MYILLSCSILLKMFISNNFCILISPPPLLLSLSLFTSFWKLAVRLFSLVLFLQGKHAIQYDSVVASQMTLHKARGAVLIHASLQITTDQHSRAEA